MEQSAAMWMYIAIVWVCFAVGGAVAAHLKNREVVEGLLLGGLLGGIGFLIEISLPAGPPSPPAGMFSEQCDVCNAHQNVSIAKPEYRCWRCGTTKKFRMAD